MVRKLFAVLAASATVVVAVPAAADTGVITDAKGDTRASAVKVSQEPAADFDILAATYGHASNDRLRHAVRVRGAIGHPRTGHGALPTLVIKVPHVTTSNPKCDYFATEVPPGVSPNTTNHWKYYMETCSNAMPTITGQVRARRLSTHRIQLVFRPGVIGSPGRYHWKIAFYTETDSPPADQVPDKGFALHVLS